MLLRRLRDWWQRKRGRPARPEPPQYLDCVVYAGPGRTEIVRYVIVGRAGYSLLGERVGATGGTRLIGPQECVDPAAWYRLFHSYLRGATLTWEDGTSADIP